MTTFARKQDTRTATLFKALSDPSRLAILELLTERCVPVSVEEMVAHIGRLSQPTVSHHISTLVAAGLIELVEKRGTYCYYDLCPGVLEEAEIVLSRLVLRAHDTRRR